MNQQLFIWAHRGASSEAPENTLAAFVAAEEADADGIELDIHLTRDGVPVVIHDPRVDRTTNGQGTVSRMSLNALRRLDAGSWFDPAFGGEPVPTLEEVLDWVDDRLRLNLEVKSFSAGQAILEMLLRFPRARVLISSFDHRLLAALRRADADLALGFLVESVFWGRALRYAAMAGAESLNPRHDLVNRPLLAECRRLGLKVYPWTVDDLKQAARFSFLGADGIFTNDPRRMGAMNAQICFDICRQND
jgi:glycerophosphoryl diester phosphodiesterase